MSADEDNVEKSRAVFALINEEGLEAALPFIDPEFEMTTPPNLATEPDTFVGHDGLRRWFDSFQEAMDGIQIVPIKLREAGDDHVAIAFDLIAQRPDDRAGVQPAGRDADDAPGRPAAEDRVLRVDSDAAEAEGPRPLMRAPGPSAHAGDLGRRGALRAAALGGAPRRPARGC